MWDPSLALARAEGESESWFVLLLKLPELRRGWWAVAGGAFQVPSTERPEKLIPPSPGCRGAVRGAVRSAVRGALGCAVQCGVHCGAVRDAVQYGVHCGAGCGVQSSRGLHWGARCGAGRAGAPGPAPLGGRMPKGSALLSWSPGGFSPASTYCLRT